MERAGRDWWRTHFSVDTLAGYGSGPKAAAEVRGLVKLLRLARGARVLDLCCGAGRHAVLLAGRGYRVTGFDIKPDLLAQARAAAREGGVDVTLLRGDARRLRFSRRFDAVVNLFTSFGYFATEAEDLALLRGARRALVPGGKFLLDVLNKEWLLRHFTQRFTKRGEGNVRRVLNELAFDFERGRLETRRVLIMKSGARRATRLSIRLYALTELERLLADAGLRFEGVFGGLNGRRYGPDAFRMVILARR